MGTGGKGGGDGVCVCVSVQIILREFHKFSCSTSVGIGQTASSNTTGKKAYIKETRVRGQAESGVKWESQERQQHLGRGLKQHKGDPHSQYSFPQALGREREHLGCVVTIKSTG